VMSPIKIIARMSVAVTKSFAWICAEFPRHFQWIVRVPEMGRRLRVSCIAWDSSIKPTAGFLPRRPLSFQGDFSYRS
jgi:hypothetical protein